MSDCCSTHTKQICPECGSTCKSVGITTLYHQVRFPENQALSTDIYYFCPAKTCSTAYFSNAGHTIPKQHLRSYQAILNDALCYCFDIDAEQYLSAINAHEAEPIKAFVVQRTQAGECACEVRNPSGQCCLANFKRLENETVQHRIFDLHLNRHRPCFYGIENRARNGVCRLEKGPNIIADRFPPILNTECVNNNDTPESV